MIRRASHDKYSFVCVCVCVYVTGWVGKQGLTCTQ